MTGKKKADVSLQAVQMNYVCFSGPKSAQSPMVCAETIPYGGELIIWILVTAYRSRMFAPHNEPKSGPSSGVRLLLSLLPPVHKDSSGG